MSAERNLGGDNPETLTAMRNLASVRFAVGDREGALVIQRRVVDGRRRVLGESHADTLAALEELGGIEERIGSVADGSSNAY